MQGDCITINLGLPEVRVISQEEADKEIIVEVMHRAESAICPRCGRHTPKVHSIQRQRKRDRRLRDKPVFLVLHKRRFRCLCCDKMFTEPDPVFGARRRSTQRFRQHLGQDALHQTVRQVNGALDQVRLQCQGREHKGKKGGLFKGRYLLLRAAESLAPNQTSQLTTLLKAYPALQRAWALKEGFRLSYHSSSRQEAEAGLTL